MSKGRDKGRLPAFVPMLRETLTSPAWRATSHGSRSLYLAVKARVSNDSRNNGRVFLSTRTAAAEIGSRTGEITRWYAELQHYGFLVKTHGGCLGVDGKGKAPHWRLTELRTWGADGQLEEPTRDFLRWDGRRFRKQNPVPENRDTPSQKTGTVASLKTGTVVSPSVAENRDIETTQSVSENRDISIYHSVPPSDLALPPQLVSQATAADLVASVRRSRARKSAAVPAVPLTQKGNPT